MFGLVSKKEADEKFDRLFRLYREETKENEFLNNRIKALESQHKTVMTDVKKCKVTIGNLSRSLDIMLQKYDREKLELDVLPQTDEDTAHFILKFWEEYCETDAGRVMKIFSDLSLDDQDLLREILK